MSTPAPVPQRPPFDLSAWLPARRSLLWIGLAFVAGLVLFALVLSRSRNDFYRADQALPTAASPRYAPLPAPLPAQRDGNASGLAKPPAASAGNDEEQPRLVETAPPAPAPALPKPATVVPAIATSRPEPLPGQTPAPRYPTQALRRGESGTVNVRVEIGPDGVPAQVSVASSSGSRHLDRAAVEAVKRWRFRPALSNGQPTAGTVIVPIKFDAQR